MRLVPSAPIFLVVLLVVTGSWASSAERVAYDFPGGTDGSSPIWYGNLIVDIDGNLYGTTIEGGSSSYCYSGCGTVFELSPSAGGWKETILYEFAGGGNDGAQPDAGLVFDKSGNLYGTTVQGGSYSCGVVFELSPTSAGGWTETILHNFQQNGRDGCEPLTPVVLDKAGNVYGTTSGEGVGTVFELTDNGGVWTETILHKFASRRDGQSPNALAIDSEGNLYGTTLYGGAYSFGTVFELTQSGGQWTENVIYSFKYYNGNHDGAYPYAGVTLGEAGVLYGTTNYGGAGTKCSPGSCGAVYRLKHLSSGWKETVLYSFRGGREGYFPVAGVTLLNGKLWGSTTAGGDGTCNMNGIIGCGTIFSLEQSDTKWVATVFPLNGRNGALPQANLVANKNGALFGTTLYGGTGSCNTNLPGCGVILKVIP